MAGVIQIRILNADNVPVQPTGLEFGISMSRTVPPAQVQLSSSFSNLADGKYYIWYRQIGSAAWSENLVITEVVTCAGASNIQALIDDYYQTEIAPAIQSVDANYQALSELMLTDISIHNFQARATGVDTNAIHATEDTSHIDFVKIVAVFLNGQHIVYDNNLPDVGDNVTYIYRDGNTLKWRASVAAYELASSDTLSLLIAR